MARCPYFSMRKAMITSQLIDMGAARQVDVVNAFGVPLPTVKRYLKLLQTRLDTLLGYG
jgi:hypothetical protein